MRLKKISTHTDEAVAEVWAARKSLCDRFGNDPQSLLQHWREQQRHFKGHIIKAPLGAKSL